DGLCDATVGVASGAAAGAGAGLGAGVEAGADAASGAWFVAVRRRKNPMARLLSLWLARRKSIAKTSEDWARIAARAHLPIAVDGAARYFRVLRRRATVSHGPAAGWALFAHDAWIFASASCSVVLGVDTT